VNNVHPRICFFDFSEEELRKGIREILRLSENDISTDEIKELFANMSDDGNSLNFFTFESFVRGSGDKVDS
jgi:hypothetical protein